MSYCKPNVKQHKLTEIKHFVKAFVINPRKMGALLPSSVHLARVMAEQVEKSQKLVVELGPGTGTITQALLTAGIPAKSLIAIEASPIFVQMLRQKFSDIAVITGDAAQFASLLPENAKVGTVISSLPLRSLAHAKREEIFQQISQVLAHGGRYIQFTYDFRNNTRYFPNQFKLIYAETVWKNLPPAKVQVFSF